MTKPIILINLKAYEAGMGRNVDALCKTLAQVQGLEKARILLAVQAADIFRLKETPFEAYAQHLDGIDGGAHTGQSHPLPLKEAGAVGSLLNHAECQRDVDAIKSAIEAAHKNGLEVCVCANTPEKGAELAAFSPDFLAIEPPDLIGGEISVSKARPEIITDSLAKIHTDYPNQQVLVGAGIKNGEDVRIALELGANGILLASGIVTHEDPAAALSDLLSVL